MGSNVKGFRIGDRVTPDQIVPCGECRFCKTGRYWMCQPHDIFGFFSYLNGGMAEYVRLPKNSLISLVPKDLPLKSALLIEPYACSKHCVDRAQIGCDDITVISGAGTLGLGMITYVRLKNPAKLIVLDMMDNRLEKAKEFGADIVWNPGKIDVVEEIMKLTDGYGCDIYIEATGHPSSVVQGMQMIRKLGRFVEFSVFGAPVELDWSIIGDRKELDVLGSHLSPYCFSPVIENISNGKLKTDGVVSKLFKLEEWEKAFDYAAGAEGDFKIAFEF
jgi:L-iditol 2-dehydrogenase